ncbi:MAG: flotillin-like protein FloA [Nitrospirota bacterium]|nr:flotillin-like protein FloA [Nitrospirota bacterium]
MEASLFVLALFALVIFGFIVYFVPVGLWIAAYSSGAYVSIGTLIAMRLRRVPPSIIVKPRISAVKAGLSISVNDLEAHYLAGGNVERVVNALISADKAELEITFARATAIDLAGRDVLEAVQMSVNPKVITTPKVAAVAKDGIQLIAQSRVTVRADLDRLVGGAGEETIVARVGEGVVSTIGSAESHKKVLENPDEISKTVLAKGLDAGTAFQILSIDIADVDVGSNIGAKLQTEQAEADKQIAQARAEGRRAMAVAQEQEMKARVHEMRAKVVEAEAEIPLAMSQAFREGNLGVMDYYNMKNVASDTKMRDSISRSVEPEEDPNKGKNE